MQVIIMVCPPGTTRPQHETDPQKALARGDISRAASGASSRRTRRESGCRAVLHSTWLDCRDSARPCQGKTAAVHGMDPVPHPSRRRGRRPARKEGQRRTPRPVRLTRVCRDSLRVTTNGHGLLSRPDPGAPGPVAPGGSTPLPLTLPPPVLGVLGVLCGESRFAGRIGL